MKKEEIEMARKPKVEAEAMALLEAALAEPAASCPEPMNPDVAAFQVCWDAYQASADAQVESEAEPLISSSQEKKDTKVPKYRGGWRPSVS